MKKLLESISRNNKMQKTLMNNTPKYMTVREVAEELRTSVSSIRRRIAEGKISYHKVAGKILIAVSHLEKYMQTTLKPARK